MADVNVRLSVSDGFTQPLTNFSKGVNGAQASTAALAGGVKKSGFSFTELASAVGLAKQAFAAAKGVIDETAGAVATYGKQVEDLSRTIGASAEESSKLIQAADDVGVSYGTLTSALQAGIRKGITPTIDGIGKLADEYNAIQNPIARTKFLMDNFGRSGAELAPLMQRGAAGIRELGEAATEAGLVMDEEGVQQAREYREAMDELDDAVMGVKLAIGQELLPDLIAAATAIADLVIETRQLAEALNVDNINEFTKSFGGFVKWMSTLSPAQPFIDGWTNQLEKLFGVTEQVKEKTKEASKAIADHTVNTISNTAALVGLGAANQVWLDAVGAQKGALLPLSQQTNDLAQAYRDLKTAQQDWSTNTASDLVAGLEAAGLKGEELRGAIVAVDTALGTSQTATFDYKTQIAGITTEFAKSRDVDAFGLAIDNLKQKYQPALEMSDKYLLSLQGTTRELQILSGRVWKIEVDYIGFEGGPGSPNPGSGTLTPPNQNVPLYAGGGNAAGRQIIVGERGPELLNLPAGGGHITNHYSMEVNATVNNDLDIAVLAHRVFAYQQQMSG